MTLDVLRDIEVQQSTFFSEVHLDLGDLKTSLPKTDFGRKI